MAELLDEDMTSVQGDILGESRSGGGPAVVAFATLQH